MRGSFALATVMMMGGACAAQATTATHTAPVRGAVVSSVAQGPDIVDLQGVRGLRFGDTRTDLDPRLDKTRMGCAAQASGMPEGSLVFGPDDRLALVWFDHPLRTPEGVHTGSTVAQVRAAYPQAQELTPPTGSYQFAGLLVTQGDRGYLFLHDGSTVQKAIAGYGDSLRQLFNTGFGAC
ncbi:hypothetical protein Cs7R123_38690 [Catellatospora sp. TT07R-123]|uniref:hypothetical protein n=1 Tax=Catellatospora sp. TT07R-123 TaxID=2733863 RepID=UPI001B0B5EFD|nr:hypothetical protein [Catellatospora sp. TT07R-123]GHJ46527.1 hypothetical protein Cs7R123_38690 [Catellatospora sp. TT07R-123]